MLEPKDFERVTLDVNGNPRYVIHFSKLNTEKEHSERDPATLYDKAHLRAKAAGGAKYRAKSHGGCFVFQSYSLDELCKHLNDMLERAERSQSF